jgi:Lar family restriction alleviation protein
MSETLKPCPFCGKEEQEDHETDEGHVVRCGWCGALGPWSGMLGEAIDLWNDRMEETREKNI